MSYPNSRGTKLTFESPVKESSRVLREYCELLRIIQNGVGITRRSVSNGAPSSARIEVSRASERDRPDNGNKRGRELVLVRLLFVGFVAELGGGGRNKSKRFAGKRYKRRGMLAFECPGSIGDVTRVVSNFPNETKLVPVERTGRSRVTFDFITRGKFIRPARGTNWESEEQTGRSSKRLIVSVILAT